MYFIDDAPLLSIMACLGWARSLTFSETCKAVTDWRILRNWHSINRLLTLCSNISNLFVTFYQHVIRFLVDILKTRHALAPLMDNSSH